jgi:hypothetical protein
MLAFSLEYLDLSARTQQAQFDFLLKCLDLGRTFAHIAESHAIGHNDTAQQALSRAYSSYATVVRLLPNLQEARCKKDINSGLKNLLTVLDRTRRRHPNLI